MSMNKPWYKSKTCWGALFIGGGMMLTGCGQFLLGELDYDTAAFGVLTGVGIILTAVGLRDAIDEKKT